MLSVFALTLIITACVAQNNQPVQPVQPQIYCGEIPSAIYSCLGNPKLLPTSASRNCKETSQCDQMRCVFRNSKWLKADGKVDKAKLIQHFNNYANEHTQFRNTITILKTNCVEKDIPAQGAFLNCAPYDIIHCALTTFFKHAPEEAWRDSDVCKRAKQWALSCPVCPESCFVPSVPVGSCNACQRLPPASP